MGSAPSIDAMIRCIVIQYATPSRIPYAEGKTTHNQEDLTGKTDKMAAETRPQRNRNELPQSL